jgi:DNA repair exonuclease SbcCD ATPase subunit
MVSLQLLEALATLHVPLIEIVCAAVQSTVASPTVPVTREVAVAGTPSPANPAAYALPKMVAQSYMNKLESQINKSLEELNIDFRVKSKEDLKFDAIFDDGVREVPVEVLSGGEKVVFSLAWRLAVNAEFANDIGILCLDEPTAGLDRDRLGCLRLAIEQMKLMSRKTGLQCIVITHAEDLMSLFDQVIEFTSPSKL